MPSCCRAGSPNADGDADPNTDLDLYRYHDANGDGAFSDDELVDQSASALADEGVNEVFPAAGRYRFVVVGYTTHAPSSYDFTRWVVDDGRPDSLSFVSPSLAVDGDPFRVTIGQTVHAALDYASVRRPGLYLGLATFHDSAQPNRGKCARDHDRRGHTRARRSPYAFARFPVNCLTSCWSTA